MSEEKKRIDEVELKSSIEQKRIDEVEQKIDSLRQELDIIKNFIQKSSIGNDGVQTDAKQTADKLVLGTTSETNKSNLATTKQIIEASDVVNIISSFKESLKTKFKALTDKEFFIFSLIYQLEEQIGAVSYSELAAKARLSESVIRDYSRSIIQKGIPIIKEKSNNKVVLLKIAPELKGLVTLDNLSTLHNPYVQKKLALEQESAQTKL